ncbi:TSC22 domain family protein 4 isoform X2 [Rhincodon typus]|uniref:TSC22 domain family protein 4 isoform X2 n=1 Tax=Rhincodon typus TaxID=259920 RepID=UPI00202E35FD|nr:TSC22 domain family protein 4 isoform X2 [Rhincodon typus]
MIGKKKSGFQITSVTSDYDGGSGEGLKEPLNGEAEAGRPAAINGGLGFGPSTETEPPGKDDRTKPPPAMAGQPAAGGEAGEVPKDTGPAGALPGTKSPPPPSPSPCSSRFRVVKLDHGLGEPYRRGRWTCVDLYDRELDGHGLAKVLDGGRHVNSLDSHPDFGALIAHRAVSQLWPRPHAPKSQGSPLAEAPRARATDTLHVLLQAAKTLSLDSPPGAIVVSSSSPSPPQPHGAPGTGGNASMTPQEKGDVAARPHPANQPHGAKAGTAETASPPPEQPPSNVKQPSSGDQGGLRKASAGGRSFLSLDPCLSCRPPLPRMVALPERPVPPSPVPPALSASSRPCRRWPSPCCRLERTRTAMMTVVPAAAWSPLTTRSNKPWKPPCESART